ncbi:MAG: uroporphyrinogen decarboxylase family protein [Planctomycetota bacterium]|jgi:uroporphyrinogen decarboxylase
MNSRQRVACALNHREPDRVPIDLGGTRQSGVAAGTYHRLKERLGVATPTRVYDLYQMLAEVERPIMERFGADVIGLYRPAVIFGIRNEGWKPWRLFDGTPVEVPGGFNPITEPNGDLVLPGPDGVPIARMPKDGFYFDRLEKFPGAIHADPDTLELPLLTDEECDHLHDQAEAYHQNTDLAIEVAMGPPFELFFGLGTGDFSAWMMTLAGEPEYVRALYEKLVEAWLENLRRLYDAVGDRVQIVQFNDDLGTQEAPFLSVPMFRELIMPYYKRGLDWIHTNTPWKVFMHNDGAIFDFLPTLIEMGVDILNPVQTTAKGMDAVKLKEQFGDSVVFWGAACDCQKTLPFGTPEEVAQEVRQSIRVFAPGGGYVLAAVHNVQAGVPPENVVALFDTAQTCGVYQPSTEG